MQVNFEKMEYASINCFGEAYNSSLLGRVEALELEVGFLKDTISSLLNTIDELLDDVENKIGCP